jgi:hypothetical protein
MVHCNDVIWDIKVAIMVRYHDTEYQYTNRKVSKIRCM